MGSFILTRSIFGTGLRCRRGTIAIMKLAELIQEKRENILRIAARHGASNVRVFGSVARGEAGPDSDVDFLIDVGQAHSSWFPAGLIIDLEDLLGSRVDVTTPDALHWFIREQVLSEATYL
jgi:predicted nucleotidyltransferase